MEILRPMRALRPEVHFSRERIQPVNCGNTADKRETERVRSPLPYPVRMEENMWPVIRKLFGILPILAGLWCLCYPAPGVWQLQLQDLGQKFRERSENLRQGAALAEKEGRKPLLAPNLAPKDLAEFVQKETGVTRKKVEGEAWEALFKRMADPSALQNGGKKYLYLPAKTPPLDQYMDAEYPYFSLELPGKYPVFLWAGLSATHSAMFDDDIPWSMSHPYTRFFPWLVGAGLLFYILTPWHRRKGNEAVYKRARSVIGPDIIGLLLTGTFMLLPLFIITQISVHPRPLSLVRGEAILSIILWFIAALGASNFAISAWYEGLRFVIEPKGISKITLREDRFYPFERMIEAGPLVWTPPAWFKKIAWLMVLVNWRMAGPVLMGAYSLNWGLEIQCRDGRTLKIWADKLLGLDKIQEALSAAGVPLSNEEPEADPQGDK